MPTTIKRNPVTTDLWNWIHHRVKMRGLTWVTLAAKFNYSPVSIRSAKSHAYPAVEKIIAEAIGMTPQALFPNRYTADGKPIGRNYPRDRKLTKQKIICNGKDLEGNCHEAER